MKIQLINPPISKQYSRTSRRGAFPPLGLLALATFLKKMEPDFNVEVLDGEILTESEILSSLDADVVGLSPGLLNYESALRIAEASKQMGCKVVFGGPHASSLAREILIHRNYVDVVIIGDGELAFYHYLEDQPLNKINNLCYRKDGQIVSNPVRQLDLNSLPPIDFSFLDLIPYFLNYQANYPERLFHKVAAIYSQKGCGWRDESGGKGCIFCGRTNKPLRHKYPQKVWSEILDLSVTHNTEHIWDVASAFTHDKNWLLDFYQKRPSQIDVNFLFYARPDDIDDECVKILSELNCFEIFLGFESGSDICLRKCNKGLKVYQNINAINSLAGSGIKLFPSFVIGLPGETQDSISQTIKLAENACRLCDVEEITASILIPFPGSKAFDILKTKEPNVCKGDILDLEVLRSVWIKHFCSVNYNYLENTIDHILNLAPIKSCLGCSLPEESLVEFVK